MKFSLILATLLTLASSLAFAEGETSDGTNISDFLSAAEADVPVAAPASDAIATPAKSE